MIGVFRWLVFAAVLAQVSVPRTPANFRIIDGIGNCPSGSIGVPPDCVPPPPAPLPSGKQWKLTYSEIDIVEILGGDPDTLFMTYHWERDWSSTLSSQTLVRQLEVDYIRIYQQQ